MDAIEIVTTVATVPAILALVELAKSFGIKGKWATLLAVILGVFLNWSTWYFGDTAWYPVVATGLILGLSAAGLYDTAKRASNETTYTTLMEVPAVTDEQLVGVDPDAPEWWNPELPNYGEPDGEPSAAVLDTTPKHAAE